VLGLAGSGLLWPIRRVLGCKQAGFDTPVVMLYNKGRLKLEERWGMFNTIRQAGFFYIRRRGVPTS